jgi:RimJ/RimL family protein N-acetyltransferase
VLRSERLWLRPVRRHDLDALYTNVNSLSHRGSYFPLGLQSEPVFRRKFDTDGFWTDDEGMLVMVRAADEEMVGEIEFFPIASYLIGFELSYLVFGPEHRTKGYATEALQMLAAYLFARHRIERLQLNIHPDNAPSQRVAEKAGFTMEGLMRQCWYNNGKVHDLQTWSRLRGEAIPR